MGIISVEAVKPGMVLAEKVMTSKGMMLLPEGTSLTDAHMLTFKTWGISQVNVVGAAGETNSNYLSPEEKELIFKEVSFIFKHNNIQSGFAKELFELACRTKRVKI